jgi:dTDP-4-amino-4,6-dideoxygalactose transaminase
MIKFLDLFSQYKSIKSDIDKAIANTISSSAFIGGDSLRVFEENFAKFCDAKHCIGVGNGTDALEISIEALNIPKGSEIIVPANSFISSSEAVTRQGHKVVFVDCDQNNYTICLDDLKTRITSKTKAIIAVHLYGHPCHMDNLKKIASKANLFIIEDCAQAHGAMFNQRKVGAIGDVGTFSFYPGKNLGAYGDGGAIVTNNDQIAKKCKMIANHGRIAKYNHEFEGRNSRLDGLQAAILSVKLKHIDEWTNKRIQIADQYLKSLSNCEEIILPKREEWAKQVYHLFVIRTERRDDLKKFLLDKEIETGIHYPISLPKLHAYDYLSIKNSNFFANSADKNLLSLPIGEHLNSKDISKVVYEIKSFFNA